MVIKPLQIFGFYFSLGGVPVVLKIMFVTLRQEDGTLVDFEVIDVTETEIVFFVHSV